MCTIDERGSDRSLSEKITVDCITSGEHIDVIIINEKAFKFDNESYVDVYMIHEGGDPIIKTDDGLMPSPVLIASKGEIVLSGKYLVDYEFNVDGSIIFGPDKYHVCATAVWEMLCKERIG